MKPVFRRPSSIIKQFSGLTVNQDKATKLQPARFMQQHNAAQVKTNPLRARNMKHILLILTLAALTACASSHTGGYGYAGNNGASAGVTQTFRW